MVSFKQQSIAAATAPEATIKMCSSATNTSVLRYAARVTNFSKAALVAAFCEALREQERLIEQAAARAHEAATHEEAKPENDKDTRALESSYLAGAQAARARELAATRNALAFWTMRDFAAGEGIGESAVVEVAIGKQRAWYLLAPHAGGTKTRFEGKEISVVTAAAPLGQALLGLSVGDEFDLGGRHYLVVSVR